MPVGRVPKTRKFFDQHKIASQDTKAGSHDCQFYQFRKMGLVEGALIKHVIHDTMNERRCNQLRVFLQSHFEVDHTLFRIVVARQTAEFGTRAAASAAAATAVGCLLWIQLHPNPVNIMREVFAEESDDLFVVLLF